MLIKELTYNRVSTMILITDVKGDNFNYCLFEICAFNFKFGKKYLSKKTIK
ncbi:hypothetical protein BTTAP_100054 [Brochothrix thermosphacta]|nr:hypothetical protein BTTAP_100054 [Brochothrix thermosphacta]